MEHMTTSRWDIGTYDLLVHRDPEGKDGDVMVVVFAHPVDPDDVASDEDAPILASIDVMDEEYDWTLEDYHLGLRTAGEKGLLTPENIPGIYGDRLGLRIVLALYKAARRDFLGLDIEDHPWRTPSNEAFPIMQRAHVVMLAVKARLDS